MRVRVHQSQAVMLILQTGKKIAERKREKGMEKQSVSYLPVFMFICLLGHKTKHFFQKTQNKLSFFYEGLNFIGFQLQMLYQLHSNIKKQAPTIGMPT